MKRDMELVRKLMMYLEEKLPQPIQTLDINIEGYSEEQIGYHLYLLYDAGLIYGTELTAIGDDFPQIIPSRLSWKGHDFVDAVRNEKVWIRIRNTLQEKLSSASFEVLTNLANKIASQILGID